MFAMYGLVLVGVVVVICYMWYGQQVLPQYRWDVRKVCNDYLEEHLNPVRTPD